MEKSYELPVCRMGTLVKIGDKVSFRDLPHLTWEALCIAKNLNPNGLFTVSDCHKAQIRIEELGILWYAFDFCVEENGIKSSPDLPLWYGWAEKKA